MVAAAQKTVLITGINGMLGRDLAVALKPYFRIAGVDCGPAISRGMFFRADITCADEMENVFAAVMPWLVIHAAAFTDVDGCERLPEKAWKINAEGTRTVAQAARRFGCRFIYLSTDYVFDGTCQRPYTVDDMPRPLNVYGASKLRGEEEVLRELESCVILRTSWLFGRHGKNFVDTIISASRRDSELRVVDDQCGCPTATDSLSVAIALLIPAVFGRDAAAGAHGIYHVCNQGACTWFEFAREIIRLQKGNTTVVPISSQASQRAAQRPAHAVLSTERFEKVTGHRLETWQVALRNYLAGRAD